MNRCCFLLLVVLVMVGFSPVMGQAFGGNPSSIKWRQVNTPYAKVIYPAGLDSVANRIATVTSYLQQQQAGSLGTLHRKVSVVLQAQNRISNAYVQLGPYRSEFYLMPPQDPFELGSLRWTDNLALHEFKHVQQNSNFNQGISRVFSVLLGQYGRAFANALAVPDWFYEGDAVWNETAYSGQGRGRLPSNYNAYKSLLTAGYNYSFMKLRNGSLKNFVPNHYDIGYLLVSYGREKYGDSLWTGITSDADRFKGLFYPWQKAVKKHTGLNYSTFTSDALMYFRQQWNNEQAAATWISDKQKNNVTSYRYPYPYSDSAVIAIKSSYRQIPVFVKKHFDGKEEKIAVKDIGIDNYFSYKNGVIVYAATKPDLRWGNRDYSVIRLLHIDDQQTISVSAKGKYFSPDINDAGNMLVLVNADPASPCILQLIQVNGDIKNSFTADSALFYSHPKFISDSMVVAAARYPDGKMGWISWNTSNNTSSWLLRPQEKMIGFPVVYKDTLFYTGTAGNADGLYAIALKNPDAALMIASYPTGIYQGYSAAGSVIGSAYTADGYRLGTFARKAVQVPQTPLPPLYAAKSFSGKADLAALSTEMHPSTSYSKAYKLLNFHSWQPGITESEYSISLLGENVLSTMYSELLYTWNRNENSHKFGAALQYGGWYVQPYGSINQTWHRQVALSADTTLQYNESDANFGLRLPLNLSFGKSFRYLTISSSISNKRVTWKGIGKELIDNANFNYLTTSISYSSQIQKAVQQIYPRFAHSISAVYGQAVSKLTAWQYLLNGSLYLPGLVPSHSLVLTGAYQARDTMQQYVFTNSFPFSRGYRDVNFPRMLRVGVNYHFPLLYPDWGFGNILYIRRVRMNTFYDYTRGKSLRTGLTYPFSTVGSEVFFDTKWWNQLPVTAGFRYSRLLDKNLRGVTNPNQWEFILPINLLPR